MTAALPSIRPPALGTGLAARPGMALAVFAALAVLVPVLTQRAMVIALALAALAALALHLRQGRGGWQALRDGWMPRLALAYVAWAGLSLIWTIDPGLTGKQAAQLAGALLAWEVLLVVVSGLDAAERRVVGMASVIGVLAGAAVIAIDGFFGLPIQQLLNGGPVPPHMLNKALVTEVLFVWPAALVLWQLGRRACAQLLMCIVAAVVLPLESGIAVLALSVGAIAAVLVRFLGRAVIWLMALGLVAGTVAMPFLVHPMRLWMWRHLDLQAWWSAHHRFYIWDFVVERAWEKPLLGWGLEASRRVPDSGWLPWQNHDHVIPLHAHNTLLQVWLELGLVGVLLLLVLLLLPLWRALSLPHDQRIFVAGAWATVVAAALPGYGAGQSWWLFTVMGLAALLLAVMMPKEES